MTYEYQIGGSLPLDAPSYIPRQADQDFYDGLKKGEFCYVLNARQMGKSSLRVRTIQRLQAEGIACATIDVTEIGSTDTTLEQWYAGLIDIIAETLPITDFDLDTWWESHHRLSPVHHFAKFLEDILLIHIQQPIVIFVDESDAITRFGEDFFALIRSCYNKRPDNPAYQRLTFAIIGVVSPTDLIADKKRTPFNIGRAIDLNGFQFYEAQPLAQGLTAFQHPEALLQIILDWTGGQPFLTQKLCQLLNDPALSQREAKGDLKEWIAQRIHDKIIKHWETQDEPTHLRHIRDRILHEGGQHTGRLLGCYQQILLSIQSSENELGGILADDSREQIELRFSGLVVRHQDKLLIYNKIYAAIFNQAWVEQTLAKLRPYANQLKAWQASGYQDESRLLQGQALQEAQTWAKDKQLSEADHQFLSTSREQALKAQMQANQVKTQRRAILGLTLFVGITAGLAFWGYLAQQQAWQNAKLAEQQRDIALEAINKRTYKWIDKLVEIPRTQEIVAEILTDNTALLDQIYALNPDTKRAKREKASNLSRAGNIWLLLGKTEEALKAYQQSLKILTKLAQDAPQDTSAQRDLSVSLNKIGNVQLQLGNTEKALQAYQQSLEIRKQLAKSDPTSVTAQRDLAVSLDNLGDVQLQLGNTEKALQAYQQSLEIRKQLAKSDPTSVTAQRDLLVSYSRIGAAQLQSRNLEVARQAFEQALAIAEQLAEIDPLNHTAQNDLSFLRNRVESLSDASES